MGVRLVTNVVSRERLERLVANSRPDRLEIELFAALREVNLSISTLFNRPVGLLRLVRMRALRLASGIETVCWLTTVTSTVALVLRPVSSVTVIVTWLEPDWPVVGLNCTKW